MTTRVNTGALSVRASSCERPVRDLEYHLRIMTSLALHGLVIQQFVLEECLPALTIPLPTDRAMKREHVYSKCIRCGWRQRSSTARGNISFEEYYCKKCGGPLLICVDVCNDKDRNKSKNGDMGQKRQKTKTENKPRSTADDDTIVSYASNTPASGDVCYPALCTSSIPC